MSPDGSFISDVPLKEMKSAAHDDDEEVIKIYSTPNSARSEEGPNNCTDCCATSGAFSVGKESLPPCCKANQDTFLLGDLPKSDGLLVIQPPLGLRQNHLPNEQCFSTDQIQRQLTGSETNRGRYDVSNTSETPGTFDATDKRPFASTGENRSRLLSVNGELLRSRLLSVNGLLCFPHLSCGMLCQDLLGKLILLTVLKDS